MKRLATITFDDAALIAHAKAHTSEVIAAAIVAYKILMGADSEGRTPDGDMAVMSARSTLAGAFLDLEQIKAVTNE